jgi:hypothetical protein
MAKPAFDVRKETNDLADARPVTLTAWWGEDTVAILQVLKATTDLGRILAASFSKFGSVDDRLVDPEIDELLLSVLKPP